MLHFIVWFFLILLRLYSMEIILPAPHSEGQERLIYSRQNDVVFAGRRWGKTFTGCQRIIESALEDPGLFWWVGLGWRSASLKRAWRELKVFTRNIWTALGEKPDKYIRESSKELHLPGGGEIWMRTAERPDSLAGEGVKGVVLDEFTLMQEIVWTEFVEATLLDYNGWALFIGVPKGNNWGAKLWRNCKEGPSSEWYGERSGWCAHHFPTSSNPRLPVERLADIKENTPSSLYQQEYEAKVIDHAGLVFKGIVECFGAERQYAALDGHTYVFGLDWGKKDDFTSIAIMDVDTKELVNLVRFNDIDYPEQLKRIGQVYRLFQPRCIIAEENALGVPLCDQLENDKMPIKRFNTTNKSKRIIIEALQVGFEQKHIKIFNDPDLIKELEEYECVMTKLGNIRYSAPPGGHDDTVMSLALAWNECKYDIGISF